MLIEIFAVIGALCFGAAAGQAVVWLWRSDLRLVLTRQPKAEPAVIAPAPITDNEFHTVHAWAQLNPWYAANPVLNMEAQIIHMGLRSREPHLSLERNLAEVTAEMHRRHPEIVPTRQ